ncbi:hypothetical protein [Nostoc sp. GT001]|nr:hypothetical protein [Nostoc sp. GT001]MDM9582500.1 hypothetical protein [Nostoc sp. GT001]
MEINERTGNAQGKAATLFNQSLEITERLGDVQTKAMTLWWL